MVMEDLLRAMIAKGANDLHIRAGRQPVMRASGNPLPSDFSVLSVKEVEAIVMPILNEDQKKTLLQRRSVEFTHELPRVGTFRCAIFYQEGMLGAVVKRVVLETPTEEAQDDGSGIYVERSAEPKLNMLLRELIKLGGSDLHLKVGRPPLFRVKGDLLPSEFPVIKQEEMEHILMPVLNDFQRERFMREKELDFSYLIEDLARFRGNYFVQMDRLGGVFRVIPIRIQSLEELGLPEVLQELIMREQGLILITGPTGSGKSTTLAGMVDFINERSFKHIVTIEDPIEFIHGDKRCAINQREVGTDTRSFAEALKHALRQDPDIVLVGEMRDPETIHTALTASETGHVVLSTLHTTYAKQSISRIVDAFEPAQQNHVRIRTAMSLVATIAQKLVKRSDGAGRVAVMEIMINTPTIKKHIIDDKLDLIDKSIEDSAKLYKMQTINQHLFQLVKDSVLTKEDALSYSYNPNDLRIMFQTQMMEERVGELKQQRPGWIKDKV